MLILVHAIAFINSEWSREWPIFVISTLGMAVIFEHWEIFKVIGTLQYFSIHK